MPTTTVAPAEESAGPTAASRCAEAAIRASTAGSTGPPPAARRLTGAQNDHRGDTPEAADVVGEGRAVDQIGVAVLGLEHQLRASVQYASVTDQIEDVHAPAQLLDEGGARGASAVLRQHAQDHVAQHSLGLGQLLIDVDPRELDRPRYDLLDAGRVRHGDQRRHRVRAGEYRRLVPRPVGRYRLNRTFSLVVSRCPESGEQSVSHRIS